MSHTQRLTNPSARKNVVCPQCKGRESVTVREVGKFVLRKCRKCGWRNDR